jgi:hypothetical protein
LKKVCFIAGLFLVNVGLLSAQTSADSVYVQSKEWYRDSNHEIQYKDWKSFSCKTVGLLNGFKSSGVAELDKFGGNSSYSGKATGFFYTVKKESRSWIIDPEGHSFYNISLNGIRPGKAPSNQKAFDEKFHTPAIWITETKKLFTNTGYNTAGSWSDVENIRAYNLANPSTPLVYTTQLSLLGNFSQKIKKRTGKKEYPELACIFNVEFTTYCVEKTKDLANYKNDPIWTFLGQ